MFYFVVVGMLGTSAVPLLSVVSGILFVTSFGRRGFPSLVSGKLKTLIVPMVAWSLPMIVLLHLEPLVTGGLPLSWGLKPWIDSLFAVSGGPANGPLHFFRDIFIMVFYGAAILVAFGRNKVAGIALAVAIVLLELQWGNFLLIRNQIAVMFVAGMLMALLGAASWRPSWPVVLGALGLYALSGWTGLLSQEPDGLVHLRVIELLARIAVSLLMWRVSFEIVRHGGALRDALYTLEPHIFVVFCSHALVIKGLGLAAVLFGWSEESPFHPVVLLSQVLIFIIVGVLLSRALRPLPWLRGKPHRGRASPARHDTRGPSRASLAS